MKTLLIIAALALAGCSAGIQPSFDGALGDAAEGDADVADAGDGGVLPDADPPDADPVADAGPDADPPDAGVDADPPDLGHDAGPPVIPCPASAGGVGFCIACDPAAPACGGSSVCCGNDVCCHMDACISETGGPARTCLDPARPL